jgi:Tfp pilus assembly protein PilV
MNRAHLHRRAPFAFTLVETMFAVFIVSITFTASMSLIGYIRMQSTLDQERARAHQIVVGEMERVRFELYTRVTGGDQITVWDNGTPDDNTDDTVGTLEVIMRKLDGSQIITAPIPAEAVQIEVALTWNPRGRIAGRVLRQSMMTYIAP